MRCDYCRSNSTSSSDSSEDLNYESNRNKTQIKRPLHHRILIGSGIGLAIIIFLLFILIWVCIPISIWLSIEFQRFLMFIPIDDPRNPVYDSPESYNLTGAINFYITTKDLYHAEKLASIGCWLVIPEDEMGSTNSTNVTEIIMKTKHDVIFYLHGVAQNRAKSVHQYSILRKYFLVIAIDHRGYGDSGINVTQSEAAIVNDHLQIYDWLKRKTSNDVYYWGHSLGTALSTHTVRALKENHNLTIKGLILESPFTSMRDEILNIVIGKVFSWLAYFNATVLHPLDYNGFQFYTSKNILFVDCPIMIMHAEDDNVIPYFLGKRLAEIAQTQRDSTCQGNVTYHQFPAVGYQHVGITEDPNVPQFIEEFRKICDYYQERQQILVENGTCMML